MYKVLYVNCLHGRNCVHVHTYICTGVYMSETIMCVSPYSWHCSHITYILVSQCVITSKAQLSVYTCYIVMWCSVPCTYVLWCWGVVMNLLSVIPGESSLLARYYCWYSPGQAPLWRGTRVEREVQNANWKDLSATWRRLPWYMWHNWGISCHQGRLAIHAVHM